jgi:glycosyltransferase involved in cell wall biosynthesis
MRELLEFDESRLAVNPLSIDIGDFRSIEPAERSDQRPPSIGYLARLAPEKGLHVLVDAFIRLHRSGRQPTARLEIAGWLGPQHADYWQQQQTKLQAAGLDEYWRYHGSVDRAGKMAFLSSIDVLSVPTTYQEPKGLFVLEAVASGVPYVQPAHGAFPELHGRLRAGHLFTPEDADELTERIGEVLDDLASARQLGLQGRQTVLDSAATEHEAERLVNLLQPLVAEKQ